MLWEGKSTSLELRRVPETRSAIETSLNYPATAQELHADLIAACDNSTKYTPPGFVISLPKVYRTCLIICHNALNQLCTPATGQEKHALPNPVPSIAFSPEVKLCPS